MRVCNCSMFCCTLLYVHSSIAIVLMGKRELIALLNLSSWCLVKVEQLFLAVPRGCLQFVIIVFPDHTFLLFLVPLRTIKPPTDLFAVSSQAVSFVDTFCNICFMLIFVIVANRKLASTYKPVAFRSVHTGIEPPFLLKIYYGITACMTRGFTSRKY